MGLDACFLQQPPRPKDLLELQAALTFDMGHTREYHVYPARGDTTQLEREHVQRYLSLYDGPVSMRPDGEPQGLAWMTSEQIREQFIHRERATIALEHMLWHCEAALRSWGI